MLASGGVVGSATEYRLGEKPSEQTIPRRCYMDKWSDAEKAIYDAMQAVERLPADVRLTDAVVLLGRAKDRVADYIDGVEPQKK